MTAAADPIAPTPKPDDVVPIPESPWPLPRRAVKRAIDVTAAAAGLAATAAPLAALAALVRLDSPGPAFYAQTRMGRGGRPFRIYKLRTMTDGADARGPAITAAGDARVTRLGRLLRRTKVDELPQLWNVLRGDMSLVGPRPEVPRYRPFYRPEHAVVLAVRPGITDLASIAFRDEESVLATVGGDREAAYTTRLLPEKLALAREYVASQSTLGDLTLLLRTLAAVAR